ncbi:hypothetical protein ACJMK2_041788 [Sinanodonta woodiana]|uniref:Uncharacterized protein n=1 Tax=Sinanodonta woodiana TaxID=1069815 RepID=A0ABD3W588_SINWO
MSHTGDCLGYSETLSAVDRITKEFDSATIQCKSTIIEKNFPDKHADRIMGKTKEELSISIAMLLTIPNIDEEINPTSDSDECGNEDSVESTDYDVEQERKKRIMR